MRVVLRRERRRRNATPVGGRRLPLPHYALVERIDLLANPATNHAASLSDRLLLVTQDNYLATGIRYSPPPLACSTLFPRLEEASEARQKWGSSRLIIDLNGSTAPVLDTLYQLHLISRQHPDLAFDLLTVVDDLDIVHFIAASCLCRIIDRRVTVSGVQQALAFPRVVFNNPRERFNRQEWQIIRLMADGMTLRNIAIQQNRPYHRIIYRLARILALLKLQKRQQLIRLLQRLSGNSVRN
ncbi:helix-turn-helix transcriptional regulator [Trabulsiella odontotermitis]|uniref:helix-turn-helix transcriptional regulator n=1 Tax=Trabulsiella odontotermitis TaxID=379893 RepID=UPI000AD1E924|nr:response regulator transcription factor [Trabulsiella odontotermitis]